MNHFSTLMASAALTSAPGAASVPSSMWLGVESIVVKCDFDQSLGPLQRQSLCHQVLARAKQVTGYPVSAVRADRADLAGQASQLVLTVSGKLVGGEKRSALAVSVRSERPGTRGAHSRQTRPVAVPLQWRDGTPELRGPLRALELLLSEPRRREHSRAPFPVRSDEF